MNINKTCVVDGFKYYFSNKTLPYQNASRFCRRKGGSLGANLTGSVIQKLATNCLDDNRQNQFFWIGLGLYNDCKPITWRPSDNCLNDSELINATSKCDESVAINLRNFNKNTDKCGKNSNHFLCQLPNHTVDNPTTTSLSSTTTQSLGRIQTDSIEGQIDTFVIAGIGAGGGVFLLLLIALICFLCKRMNNCKKQDSEEPFILDANVVQNHINHFFDQQHSEGDNHSTPPTTPVYLNAPSVDYENVCHDDADKSGKESKNEPETVYESTDTLNDEKKREKQIVKLNSFNKVKKNASEKTYENLKHENENDAEKAKMYENLESKEESASGEEISYENTGSSSLYFELYDPAAKEVAASGADKIIPAYATARLALYVNTAGCEEALSSDEEAEYSEPINLQGTTSENISTPNSPTSN